MVVLVWCTERANGIGVGGVKSSILDDGSMVVLVLVVGCCRRRSQATGMEELYSSAEGSRAVSIGKARRNARIAHVVGPQRYGHCIGHTKHIGSSYQECLAFHKELLRCRVKPQ